MSDKKDEKDNKSRIRDVRIVRHDFKDLAKKVESAYELKFTDAELKEIAALIPRHSNSIRYKVNACTALCNGWRRVMLDELPYPRLTVKMDDIRTDDPFAQRQTDYLQNRIQLIPTSYIPPGEDLKGSLEIDVKNDSKETITVTSKDIKAKGNLKIEWSQEIELFELNPGRWVKIPLSIEWGINLTHGSFSIIGPLHYEALDQTPDKYKSYQAHPQLYDLGLTVESLLDPVLAVKLGWQTLLKKVTNAKALIAEFAKTGKIPYQSPLLKVLNIKGNRTRYEFINETLTLGNILSYFAYLRDTTIKFIQAGDDHPEDNSILVKINHPEHAKLLMLGCDDAILQIQQILTELETVK